ncbi:VOC family protein [Parasalinivibrio latis]|uniref:VOC family protein n=1 Tax=Parasalinivibrio latis TaxID=2952610 RepID=UPI0030DFA0C3
METLKPHITFSGKCREALQFYCACFDGEVILMQTFDDAPVELLEVDSNRIMHAEFESSGISFMASDGMVDEPIAGSGSVALAINFCEPDEQDKVFAALSHGGQVIMPLSEMFWSARFGQVVDKYGIRWMLNCPLTGEGSE